MSKSSSKSNAAVLAALLHNTTTLGITELELHIHNVLKTVPLSLTSTAEDEHPDETEGLLAEHMLLSQASRILESHVFECLLAYAIEIPQSKLYWKETELSAWKTAVHVVELLPSRLFRLGSFVVSQIYQQIISRSVTKRSVFSVLTQSYFLRDFGIDNTPSLLRYIATGYLSTSPVAHSPLNGPITNSSILSLPLRLLSSLDLAKWTIRTRRVRLEKVQSVISGLLGILFESSTTRSKPTSIVTALSSSSTLERTQLDESFKLLDAIRQKILVLMESIGSDEKLDECSAPLSPLELFKERDVLQFSSNRDRFKWILEFAAFSKTLPASLRTVALEYGTPPPVTRLWLPILGSAVGVFAAAKLLIPNLAAMKRAAKDGWATLGLFFEDWVLGPLKGIYNTIRHREERLTIMGRDSLNSDLESLERMVISFAKDQGLALNDEELTRISSAVQHGDLTLVLQNYENEIRRPFRNTISGDLVRSVLIQVQKAKVDLELAMSALDKLLRANELNFAFLAVIPTFLLIYFGTSNAVGVASRYLSGGRVKSYELIRVGLREVERLLNRATSGRKEKNVLNAVEVGMLVCEVHALRSCVSRVPVKYRAAFKEDLEEIGNPAWTISQRLSTCHRMYRTYPFFIEHRKQ